MSAPMSFAVIAGDWLFLALAVLALLVEVWAFADVLRRSPQAFERVGGRPKSFWLLLTGIAVVVGVLSVLTSRGGLGLFGLAAVCVASVYLAGTRPDLDFYGGRR